jgi:hypothetical protein
MSIIYINPYQFAAAAPWTPADITTALWLDAADASTITESGGAVSQWDDKSGNSRNAAQGTPANRPVYPGTGLNGKSTIDFDGSNDVLTATLSTGLSSSFAVFAVVVPLRNQAIEGYVVSEVASYSNYWFALGRGGTGGGQKMGMSLFDGANNPISEYTTLPTLGVGYIMGGIRDTTSGARKLFYYQDGTLRGNVADNTSLAAPAYSNLQIGGQVNQANRYGNVRLGEVVIVPSLPTADTRQKIEGYLAHKWGLTASLPADHPYKSAAP